MKKQNKEETMKTKVFKIVIGLLLIIVGISLLVISYFMIAEIETKVPENIENKYDLTVEKYLDRNIFIVKSKNETKSNIKILYFHGGSYMAEATKQHWEFIENLVNDTGATVILPDYPLTPKYNYKDVFNMVIPLYKEIQQKINVNNELILMGDSAGGGLALALLESLTQEENIVMPSKTILISPWLDVRLNNSEIEKSQEKDKKLNKEALKLSGIAYAGEDGINSYLVNPIDGDLSKLTNLTIFTGTNDILNPDVHVLQEKAKQMDVRIDVKEYENATHIWLIDKDCDQKIVEKSYQDLISTIKSNN